VCAGDRKNFKRICRTTYGDIIEPGPKFVRFHIAADSGDTFRTMIDENEKLPPSAGWLTESVSDRYNGNEPPPLITPVRFNYGNRETFGAKLFRGNEYGSYFDVFGYFLLFFRYSPVFWFL